MARKTKFFLERLEGKWLNIAEAVIIGQQPESNPYVNIAIEDMQGNRMLLGIQDKDLERFAVNILKALGSKKLAFSQRYKSKTFIRKKLK